MLPVKGVFSHVEPLGHTWRKALQVSQLNGGPGQALVWHRHCPLHNKALDGHGAVEPLRDDGTHSSRRWISSGWAGPNWLFVKVCTVPKAEFFVL